MLSEFMHILKSKKSLDQGAHPVWRTTSTETYEYFGVWMPVFAVKGAILNAFVFPSLVQSNCGMSLTLLTLVATGGV